MTSNYDLDIINIIIFELDIQSILKLSATNNFFNNSIRIINQIRQISVPTDYSNLLLSVPEILMAKACRQNSIELVSYLIKNQLCRTELYPLFVKSSLKNKSITKLLLESSDMNLDASDFLDACLEIEFMNCIDSKTFRLNPLLKLHKIDFVNEIDFGKRCRLSLDYSNASIREINLVIDWPDINSKPDSIYKIINKFEIIIGGSTIVSCDSSKLQILDQLTNRTEKVNFLSNYRLNRLCYPIDLTLFFGPLKDSGLDGLIRGQMLYHECVVCIEFGENINASNIKFNAYLLAKYEYYYYLNIEKYKHQYIYHWQNVRLNYANNRYQGLANHNLRGIYILNKIIILNSDCANKLKMKIIRRDNSIIDIDRLPIVLSSLDLDDFVGANVSNLYLELELEADCNTMFLDCQMQFSLAAIHDNGLFSYVYST